MKTEELKKIIDASLFDFELHEYVDGSLVLEGEYFTLDYQPSVEGIQIHAHEKTDIIVECMMEELSEMSIIREQLEELN
jgi:hypothetical protein